MTKFKRDEIEKEYQFYKLFKIKKKIIIKKVTKYEESTS
jgi:hypothetical protein